METYIDITQIAEIANEESVIPSQTYKIDFDNKIISGKIDGLEAVAQSIVKALMTPRFSHLIYDNQYGSEIIAALRDANTTREFIETDISRIVKDTLLVDKRILSISKFSFEYSGERANIEFTVDTIFGTTEIEVMI